MSALSTLLALTLLIIGGAPDLESPTSACSHDDLPTLVARELDHALRTLPASADCSRLRKHADLRGCDLRYRDLTGAHLKGADLRHARLDAAKLDGADLRGALLDHASLTYASLRSARLQGASLAFADLRLSNLAGAQLLGADFSDADLTAAVLLATDADGVNWSNAICPDETPCTVDDDRADREPTARKVNVRGHARTAASGPTVR